MRFYSWSFFAATLSLVADVGLVHVAPRSGYQQKITSLKGQLIPCLFLCAALIFYASDVKATKCKDLPVFLNDYLKDKRIESCRVVEQGVSCDRVYILKISNTPLVVAKLLNAGRPEVSRAAIISATRWIGQHRWGPSVVWSSKDNRLFIMEFLHDPLLLRLDGQEEKMGHFLHTIHQTLQQQDFKKNVPPYSLYEKTTKKWQDVKAARLLSPPIVTKIEEMLEELMKAHDTQIQAVLHNDLKPSNIMKGNHSFYLLDWGEMSIASIYDELGMLAFYFQCSPAEERQILKGYWGRSPTEKEVYYLQIHRDLASLHFALWAIERGGTPVTSLDADTADYTYLQSYILKHDHKSIAKPLFTKVGGFILKGLCGSRNYS